MLLLHRDNIVDDAIAALPAARRAAVDARYAPVALDPRGFRFIDRVAADSRQVALNHVAGLSTPQQAQMALFALYALLDRAGRFKSAARAVVRRRLEPSVTYRSPAPRAAWRCSLVRSMTTVALPGPTMGRD